MGVISSGFLRWYLRQGWNQPWRKIVLPLLVFGAAIAWALYWSFEHPSRASLLGLLENPFFDFALLYLTASDVGLNYMRYKLFRSGKQEQSPERGIRERREVPKEYQRIYGEDVLTVFWKSRWVAVAVVILVFFHAAFPSS